MPEFGKVTIVRKSVFDLSAFYQFLWSFLVNIYGYSFQENDYSEWVKGNSKDVEFHWTFKLAKDSYTTLTIWVECKVRGVEKVKMKSGDDMKSMEKGELELNIQGMFQTDASGTWAKHPILSKLKNFYEKIIYRQQLLDYVMRLWETVYNAEKEVKTFFGLPNYM